MWHTQKHNLLAEVITLAFKFRKHGLFHTLHFFHVMEASGLVSCKHVGNLSNLIMITNRCQQASECMLKQVLSASY